MILCKHSESEMNKLVKIWICMPCLWQCLVLKIQQLLDPLYGGARGVMVIIVGNGHGDTSSNPGQANCTSHSTNTLGKGMNPIILPPAMGK